MYTFPSGDVYSYSGTEVVLNRTGYLCVTTYTVAYSHRHEAVSETLHSSYLYTSSCMGGVMIRCMTLD